MARRAFCFIALTALLSLSCRTTAPKDERVVAKLTIHGTRQVKAGELKKRILTAETSWIPFSHLQYFDPDIWRTDLHRIERYYRERGLYQAKIVSQQVIPKPNNRVDLVVQVDEGKPTLVSTVNVTGLEELPEDQRQSVLGRLPLKPGDVFLEDQWEALKGKLASALHNMGYAEATVNGIAEVDLATQRASLKVSAQPGQRYKFGEIHVRQNENPRVPASLIRESAESKVVSGNWYSEEALDAAQARVSSLGVFGAVKVQPETPDTSAGTVPVEVNAQEAPFHQLRLGVGIGFDIARNDGQLLGQYTDRDFFGGLRKLTLNASAGWAWIPNAYTTATEGGRNGPVAKLSAQLEQPRVIWQDVRLQGRIELERGMEPAYSFIGGRTKLGVVWTPSRYVSVFPSYNFEIYRLQEGEVTGINPTAPQLLLGCSATCTLSYIEERVDWDRRDDRQEPHRGYFLSLILQEGGGPLGGSFRFVKAEPEGRYYLSDSSNRFTLAARLRLGSIWSSQGESPIVVRFFSGGANEMRGFSSRRLSPMQIVANPNATKSNEQNLLVPIGGDGLIESTLEARYRIAGPLVLATFIDAGEVTSASLNGRSVLSNLLYAVGFGVRYLTPIGAIRLDLAYRLNVGPPLQVSDPDHLVPNYPSSPSALTYPVGTGCFGIGRFTPRSGYPEGACQVHVSIGEAF